MELKHAIYSILSQESQLLSGEIHLIMQPDSDFIMDTLAYIGKTKNDLSIDHIICLNNDDSLTTDKKDYNLRCLQNIIPMYRTCNCRYTPYYYYDSIVSHNNKFNLLSSMILTSEYGICFSPSLKYGVLFRSQEIRSKLLSVFRDLLKDTRPLVCRFDSVFSQLEYFDKLGLGSSPGISFQKEPCLMPLLPPSYIDKYLIDELPNRDYTILSIKEYLKALSEQTKQNATRFLFSKEGVLNFLKTGRVFELPDSIYKPLDPHDRVALIRSLIAQCRDGRFQLLRRESPFSDVELCMYVTAQKGYLLFASSNDNLVYLNLEEPSLLFTFYDYLSSLEDTTFYSAEEAVSLLTELVKEYHF